MFLCPVVLLLCYFFFCKQKTAYEMRISDWSSDVCSSDLRDQPGVVRSRRQLGKDGFVAANEELDAEHAAAVFAAQGIDDLCGDRFGTQIGRASCRERVCQYV